MIRIEDRSAAQFLAALIHGMRVAAREHAMAQRTMLPEPDAATSAGMAATILEAVDRQISPKARVEAGIKSRSPRRRKTDD